MINNCCYDPQSDPYLFDMIMFDGALVQLFKMKRKIICHERNDCSTKRATGEDQGENAIGRKKD